MITEDLVYDLPENPDIHIFAGQLVHDEIDFVRRNIEVITEEVK